MKNTSHILEHNRRHESDPRDSRKGRNFPHTDQNYRSSKLHGACGTPTKFHHPAFFEISNEYFAEEAPRGSAVDAGVFAALMLAAMLPIASGVQAVATLIHSVGVL
jgi:hypothetical protein